MTEGNATQGSDNQINIKTHLQSRNKKGPLYVPQINPLEVI